MGKENTKWSLFTDMITYSEDPKESLEKLK